MSVIENIEREELIKKLIDAGYGDIVDVFLNNENKVYTKKGRLNKSGACRALKYKPKELEEMLQKCKKLLEKDMD